MRAPGPSGAGLGFRRELLSQLDAGLPPAIDFFELAPENWAGMGGRSAKQLRGYTERFPFVCHGLSLDLGGPRPLDEALLRRIKGFMREHGMQLYTEHLSWCGDDGQLYDLLPIPCSTDAVRWVADRIRRAQDILGMRIGIENASYYVAPPGAEMSEAEFITAVVREADCLLHLDVNNIYVNSLNFGFDALVFMRALPLDRTCYLHVAGHYVEDDGLRVDTHGAPVIDPVWVLLDAAYELLRPATDLPRTRLQLPGARRPRCRGGADRSDPASPPAKGRGMNAPMPFQEFQIAFGRHLRDPRGRERPAGVPARRAGLYRELLRNNLEGFLLACFPSAAKCSAPDAGRGSSTPFSATHAARRRTSARSRASSCAG
jgi:uncharacterized protein (UPF0276 family)